MIKYTILFFLLFSCAINTHAQENIPVADSGIKVFEEKKIIENSILSDTLLEVHSINILPDSIVSWKNKKEFGYAKKLDSLLKDQQKENAGDKISTDPVKTISFFDRLFSSGIVQLILWMLAILFVGYILYNLFLSKGMFKKDAYAAVEKDTLSDEDIFVKQDYDALVRQAYRLEDYRLATRYLFLKTLQRLNQQSLIAFAADKTNSKYVHEIKPDKRNEFATLVMNYEYVWYGNVRISKDLFERIEAKFSLFIKKV